MSGGFRPQVNDCHELFRERPRDDPAYVAFTGSGGFMCFILAAALVQMSRWAEAAGSNEIIGRLGGRHCRDAHGAYVLVEWATLCRDAKSSTASVCADDDAQRRLRHDFAQECRSLDPIGWFHSHVPDVGLFYSSVDRANQRTWDHPDSIGIVLHAVLAGEGLRVYRGPECEELTLNSPEALKEVRRRLPRAKFWHVPVTGVRLPKSEAVARSRSNTIAAVALVMAACSLVVSLGTWVSMTAAPATPERDGSHSRVQRQEEHSTAGSAPPTNRAQSTLQEP